MSRKFFLFPLILLFILLLASCKLTPPTLPPGDLPVIQSTVTVVRDDNLDQNPTPRPLPDLDFDAITRCQETDDCMIVVPECCGNYTAINQEHLTSWNRYQEALKDTCPEYMCEPLLPIDTYVARCIDQLCTLREAACEQEILDPAHYQDLIRQHPYLTQLETDLNLLEVQVPDPCVMAGKVRLTLRFEIPSGLSNFGMVYMADLRVWYSLEDGFIEPAYDPDFDLTAGPTLIDPDKVLDYLSERVLEIETEPRVIELVEQLGWDSTMGRIYLSTSHVLVQFHHGSIEFGYPMDGAEIGVFGYVVPNDLDLAAFPELQIAHHAIQEQLLVGEWTHCSINKGTWSHSLTSGHRWYDNPNPWWLEVDLDCNGEWRVASIKINPDGSYERLEIY